MRFRQNTFLLLVVAALVAVTIGIFRTNQGPVVQARANRRSLGVDQSSLITAEQLVRLPTTPEERTFAYDALRLADQEMDLAFAQAVRRASTQPPVKSAEVLQLNDQLRQAIGAAAADQVQVTELTAAVAKAAPSAVQGLTDRLELAKAQLALDQDEVDDARQDLQRAGGDPQGRIQSIVAEHEAASRSSDSTRIVITRAPAPHGMLGAADAVFTLRDKVGQLDAAKHAADSLAAVFKQRHDSIEARAARMVDSANAHLTHDSSAALLELTRNRAASEKRRATLDQRMDNQTRLSDTYAGWSAVVSSQARAMFNQVLRSAAAILAIILGGMLLARWFELLARARVADHRRAQTLYMIRASLQVIGVLVILLIVFGPPNDVGTVVGLAAAGLSVALKDFIVGFLGWFVLMGKNGIRVGDQVEINGVTGEVVEIGMFYTVLLETGAWSESNPTGRRVTFNNSFAIEGHYFNFSTSGRWMWDEVRIQVAQGRDPHAIAAALEAQIESATAESARLAEEEWSAARRSPHASAIAAAPSISIRPASSGFEIIARYITQASERDALRARLYQTAIELLGAKDSGPKYGVGAPPAAAPTR
jgi:small-conductance mechanosensitive channel